MALMLAMVKPDLTQSLTSPSLAFPVGLPAHKKCNPHEHRRGCQVSRDGAWLCMFPWGKTKDPMKPTRGKSTKINFWFCFTKHVH